MTGQNLLAEQLKISRQNIRTAITNLKSTNELTIKTSKLGTIIQIVRYKKYQVLTNKLTTDQPEPNQSLTTNKNVKKDKEVIKEIPSIRLFQLYAKENDKDYAGKINQINLKYKAWVENDWKDGNNKPIKNWKTKLLHALGYMRKDYKQQQQRL